MSPEAQRIAISTHVGWTINQIEFPEGSADVSILPPGVSVEDEGAVWNYAGTQLPDYPNDLNAMNEAEGTLTPDQKYLKGGYCDHLDKICGGRSLSYFAKSVQRAEAFLRTIGKWQE